jgi:hypothetical protein
MLACYYLVAISYKIIKEKYGHTSHYRLKFIKELALMDEGVVGLRPAEMTDMDEECGDGVVLRRKEAGGKGLIKKRRLWDSNPRSLRK